MSGKIIASISADSGSKAIPKVHPQVFEDIFLCVCESNHTFIESVRSDGMGGVTGGGTKISTSDVIRFGARFFNLSTYRVDVWVEISQIDASGYVVARHKMHAEVRPGERVRAEALNPSIYGNKYKELAQYKITMVTVREHHANSKIGTDTVIRPDASLFDLFDMGNSQLAKNKKSKTLGFFIGFALVMMVIIYNSLSK